MSDLVDVPYRRAIYWKAEPGENGPRIVVYSPHGLIQLNETASLVWELMDGHHTVKQILVALRGCFPNVPAERLKEDLEEFLRTAEDMSLIMRHWSPLQPYEILSEELVP